MKDPEIGHRFVPIIPDEARTFGLDSLFPSKKIYSPHGQNYLSVDREQMLSYQEDIHGVLLHEGITEAGSAASWTAAGTSYATHGEPMIPLYIFYSMFGFQRTGDQLWAAADQMTRGFLLGRHRRPHHPQRRRPAAPRRPFVAAGIDQPRLRRLRRRLRLRARPHHRRRTPAHVRRTATRRRPERLLLPHPLQRADRAAGRARPTSTSTGSSPGCTATPPPRTAMARRRRSLPPASRCPGQWKRNASCKPTGASRPTCGR